MKTMGPIPADFLAGRDGALAVGGRSVNDWVAEAGTPLFLYDRYRIAGQVARFRSAFPSSVALHYAVKANPYAPLLTFLGNLVDGFDLASAGELHRLSEATGLAKPVSMAGPGKREADLEAALRAGAVIHIESEGEAARALAIANRLSVKPTVAVRVNPPFALKAAGMKMGGLASPFGVDSQRVPALVRWLRDSGADWRGFHVYAGSQLLHADILIDAQRQTIELAARLAEEAGAAPREVNLGGGFGIPYASGEKPLDIVAVGAGLAEALDRRPDILRDTTFAIELGRWLVGEAGVYLSRVVDVKESGGKRFAITDGGLQHVLAASGNFGQLLRRNYPIANASHFAEKTTQDITITGCLCTPLDLLGDDLALPEVRVGDLIAIFCNGAYGLTASPQDFLSQPVAAEVLA